MTALQGRQALCAAILGAAVALAPAARAEVVFQGQPNTSFQTGAVTITAAQGQTAGGNLLHSFSVFNVFATANESVRFVFTNADPRGPGTIRHVISRVSGDQGSLFAGGARASFIDGPLRSDLAGANLVLVNPNGISFGPRAQVHVDGSFFASTADRIEFDGADPIHARPQPGEVLTSAPPSAFGFMGGQPAAIRVDGAQLRPVVPANPPFVPAALPATLVLPAGKTFALVGGNVTLQRDGLFGTPRTTLINAPTSTVALVSVAGEGRVPLAMAGGGATAEGFGTVTLRDSSVLDARDAYVRSGRLVIDQSIVSRGSATVLGVPAPRPNGGSVRVHVDGDVTVTGSGRVFGIPGLLPGIFSFTNFGPAAAAVPSIHVSAGELTVSGTAAIRSLRQAQGNPGSVVVEAGRLTVRDGGVIGSTNYAHGPGTDVHVDAGTVLLRGDGGVSVTGLTAQSESRSPFDALQSRAGRIVLEADALTIANGAEITTDSFGFGPGGDVDIHVAGPVVLSRDGAPRGGILAQSVIAGDSGDVTLRASSLHMSGGFQVSATTAGFGNAGRVEVDVTGPIVLSGDNTGIFSRTQDVRQSDLDALARRFQINLVTSPPFPPAAVPTPAQLPVESFDELLDLALFGGGFFTSVEQFMQLALRIPATPGAGGTIHVSADSLLMGADTRVDSSTTGDGPAGNVHARLGSLRVEGGAQLRSRSGGIDRATQQVLVGAGAGGTVDVAVSGQAVITGISSISGTPSQISTSTFGPGNGGNVRLASRELRIERGGTMSAASFGTGLAGDIHVVASDQVTLWSGSISTEATVADGGNITLVIQRLLDMVNSTITTSVQSGVGAGGNIDIDPDFVILQNSSITANAFGGPGGNIRIVARKNFISDPESSVTASSARNIDGTVEIDAPDTDVTGSLTALPENFLDAGALLQGRCDAARARGRANSLTVSGRGGVSPDPDGYQSGLAVAGGAAGIVPASPTAGPVGVPVASRGGVMLAAYSADCRR